MIPDKQAFEIIDEHFPQLDINKEECSLHPYKEFDAITDHAINFLEEEKYNELERLLSVMSDLYEHCNTVIRNCIENVFIYKLLSRIECTTIRSQLLARVPQPFLAIIHKQINAAAI